MSKATAKVLGAIRGTWLQSLRRGDKPQGKPLRQNATPHTKGAAGLSLSPLGSRYVRTSLPGSPNRTGEPNVRYLRRRKAPMPARAAPAAAMPETAIAGSPVWGSFLLPLASGLSVGSSSLEPFQYHMATTVMSSFTL